MKLKTVDTLPALHGKKVFLRLTMNVPVVNAVVTDDYRLGKILPTLKTLIERGAEVIVGSHMGSDGAGSLLPAVRYLESFVPAGSFTTLPNLRLNSGELSNDLTFARELAGLADYYVNEDFPASHREHASLVSLPKFLPSCFGYQFIEEVEHLSRFVNPPPKSMLILGGIKLSTKLPLIKSFLSKVEKIFLGSYYVYEKDNLPKDDKIVLPVDVIKNSEGKIVDIGPRTLNLMQTAIVGASAVIWNGPMGKLEAGYKNTTEKLAKAIVTSKCQSVVGGGDSVAAIRKLGLLDEFTFVSTGGGAMLDFLTNGTLPGIDAIMNNSVND